MRPIEHGVRIALLTGRHRIALCAQGTLIAATAGSLCTAANVPKPRSSRWWTRLSAAGALKVPTARHIGVAEPKAVQR